MLHCPLVALALPSCSREQKEVSPAKKAWGKCTFSTNTLKHERGGGSLANTHAPQREAGDENARAHIVDVRGGGGCKTFCCCCCCSNLFSAWKWWQQQKEGNISSTVNADWANCQGAACTRGRRRRRERWSIKEQGCKWWGWRSRRCTDGMQRARWALSTDQVGFKLSFRVQLAAGTNHFSSLWDHTYVL